MRQNAPNFRIEPGAAALHPLPAISYFNARGIQIETSAGRRPATELTIHGTNFLIRAVEPDVLVNGEPLVSYRIDDDFQTITGHFFGVLTQPVQLIVDYGLGVRCEWTGYGNVESGKRSKLLRRLLLVLLLLLLLLLTIVIVALAGVMPMWLNWVLLTGSIALDIIAILLIWDRWGVISLRAGVPGHGSPPP